MKKKSRSSGKKKREAEAARREAEEAGKRMASKEEIDGLISFIGGFMYWPWLNTDCKRHVAKYLDFRTQQSLKMCSKRDIEVADLAPCHLYSMEIIQDPFLDHKNKGRETMIQFQFGDENSKIHRLLFCQLGPTVLCVTVLEGLRMLSHNWKIWNTDHRTFAMFMAEKYIRKGRFQVEKLTVQVGSYPFQNSIIKKLPMCKTLKLKTDDIYSYRWWLTRIPKQMDYLEFEKYESKVPYPINFSETFMKLPHVHEATRITLHWEDAVNDEQFLNMKAKQFCLNANLITEDAYNQFLTRWATGKGIKEFEQFVTERMEKTVDWAKILEGLEHTRWEEDNFLDLRPKFRHNHSSCLLSATVYQVKSRLNPFDSLTVARFQNGMIVVEHTGHKGIDHRGDECTEYKCPDPIFPNPFWTKIYHYD